MIRTFHSVGQGALYSENFHNFIMVYDCGSYKNKTLIENELKNSFDNQEVINAVFISHFHEDHINGLEFLLKNYRIKYLFIPLLADLEKIVLVIENVIHGTRNAFIEGIILNPEETINNNFTQIIRVQPADDDISDEEISLIDNQNFPSKIKSGSKLRIAGYNWLLVPFHFKRREKTKQFTELLKTAGIEIKNQSDLLALLEDESKLRTLEQCYKEVKGTLNSNSLVLYSGPNIQKDKSTFASYPLTFRPYTSLFPWPAGCIYFGDYDASGKLKWKEFESLFSKYWQDIGCVQIPHHGSRHNYNININERQPVLSILSCGEKNHFCHPHGSVLKSILKNEGYPLIVTEKPHTRVLQKILLI